MWNPGLVGDIQPIQTNYGKFGSGFNQQGWQHEMVGNTLLYCFYNQPMTCFWIIFDHAKGNDCTNHFASGLRLRWYSWRLVTVLRYMPQTLRKYTQISWMYNPPYLHHGFLGQKMAASHLKKHLIIWVNSSSSKQPHYSKGAKRYHCDPSSVAPLR